MNRFRAPDLIPTTEATVRQQAQSIYGKANLPGKTAFSAFFLEDLFTPEGKMDDFASSLSRARPSGITAGQGSRPNGIA